MYISFAYCTSAFAIETIFWSFARYGTLPSFQSIVQLYHYFLTEMPSLLRFAVVVSSFTQRIYLFHKLGLLHSAFMSTLSQTKNFFFFFQNFSIKSLEVFPPLSVCMQWVINVPVSHCIMYAIVTEEFGKYLVLGIISQKSDNLKHVITGYPSLSWKMRLMTFKEIFHERRLIFCEQKKVRMLSFICRKHSHVYMKLRSFREIYSWQWYNALWELWDATQTW